jgi:hypothetical protein
LARSGRLARFIRIGRTAAPSFSFMAGPTQLRLASISAAAYGAFAIAGALQQLQRGSLIGFVHALARPSLWLVLLVALVLAWGLWMRYAWAWWLGVAAAGWQVFVILDGHVRASGLAHLPRPATLLALALLVFMLTLLLQRRARAAANR